MALPPVSIEFIVQFKSSTTSEVRHATVSTYIVSTEPHNIVTIILWVPHAVRNNKINPQVIREVGRFACLRASSGTSIWNNRSTRRPLGPQPKHMKRPAKIACSLGLSLVEFPRYVCTRLHFAVPVLWTHTLYPAALLPHTFAVIARCSLQWPCTTHST